MGQNAQKEVTVQRIRPAPGSSGIRFRRKNTVSVYSEITHSISSIKVDFDMTVTEFKQMISCENYTLSYNTVELEGNYTLRDYAISEKSLIKVVPFKANDSTGENSAEILNCQLVASKPINHRYNRSIQTPFKCAHRKNLSVYSVPEVKLCIINSSND